MSFEPLTRVACGPPKQRKYPPDVIGTPNVSFGHRLLERSNCRSVRKESFFEGRGERPEDRREYEQLLKTFDFEKQTNRRIKRKKAWQKVQEGMTAYEEGVNARREKLRDLILREETALTREIVDQAQHGDDARMDEMRQRTNELKERQEEQRVAVVAAKRMQQYLARCPEIREELLKKSTVDAKRGNVAQMADNEARKQAEKELDDLWHELMLKEIEAKKHREIEEAKRLALVQQDTVTVLAKQVAGKLALEDEKKQVQKEEREYLEQLWETVRQEELNNLARERRNRETLKKQLEEQIITTKRFLADRAREESAMDRVLRLQVEEELAKEKSSIQKSTIALRKELLAYLGYLEDVRREEARRDLEVNAIVEESRRNAEARRDLAKRKFKEARERGLREVLRGREEQMKSKREAELKEEESRRAERELLEKEIELDAKLTAEECQERRRRASRYATELKEQQMQMETMRRREAEEDEKIRQESLKRDEEYRRLTRELLEASENITPHPFKRVLQECAARREAEREGRCYCPPPLAPE